jgi:hypothetical protein
MAYRHSTLTSPCGNKSHNDTPRPSALLNSCHLSRTRPVTTDSTPVRDMSSSVCWYKFLYLAIRAHVCLAVIRLSSTCLVAYAAVETRMTHGRQPYVTNAKGLQLKKLSQLKTGLEILYLLRLANKFILFIYLFFYPVQYGNLLHEIFNSVGFSSQTLSFVDFPRLLVQYICTYPPHMVGDSFILSRRRCQYDFFFNYALQP